MLAHFQFPISDARTFHAQAGLRRERPDWPSPRTDIHPQFVHYFGRAVERRRAINDVLPYESRFCQARRALRFVNLKRDGLGSGNNRFWPHCAFRRLFFDGECVARVEIGLTQDPRSAPLRGMTAHELLGIASGLCDLETIVPQVAREPRRGKFIGQGASLARLFARATKAKEAVDAASIAESLVEDGSPLLLLHLERNEMDFGKVLEGFSPVDGSQVFGARLAFGRLRTRGGVISTWILERGSATEEEVRSLRLCVLRLHAEQEALDIVLKQIKRNRLLEPFDAGKVDLLNAYLNNQTRLLSRDQWGGVSQRAVLAAYDAAEQVSPPSAKGDLAERYEGARNQVWKKVEDYQARRAAVRLVKVVNVEQGGIVVDKSITVNQSGTGNVLNIAEYMSGVTNNVNNNLANAQADDDLKALVRALTDQIGSLSKQVDPKHTQNMGDSAETISKEMAKSEPRREWYEVSLKGLKEAAEAVGELGKPILETVKKLWPLLLP
ncbi:hypothetical protein BWI17_11355 [Betaproteobacteria bacterium GR16-43]|nr:hypothetical protein BWI17_11355 [Betaproteobacteria bacterium GR16-43]